MAREFNAIDDADSHLPVGERSTVTLVMATRPWRYSLYEGLRKKGNARFPSYLSALKAHNSIAW